MAGNYHGAIAEAFELYWYIIWGNWAIAAFLMSTEVVKLYS